MRLDFSNRSFKSVKIMGIGGCGIAAIDRMIPLEKDFDGLEFLALDTNFPNISQSKAKRKIYLDVDQKRKDSLKARRSKAHKLSDSQSNIILDSLQGSDVIFLVGGLGDRTVAEIISHIGKLATELGSFTIAFVTLPFSFEARERIALARKGFRRLQKNVNTIFILPNDEFCKLAFLESSLKDVHNLALDNLIYGIQELVETILRPGFLSDIHFLFEMIFNKTGTFCISKGCGKNRAIEVARKTIKNLFSLNLPLNRARIFLLIIKASGNLMYSEINEICSYVLNELEDEKFALHSNVDIEKEYSMIRTILYSLFDPMPLPSFFPSLLL